VIDEGEAEQVREAAVARRDAIEVDSFSLDEYLEFTEAAADSRIAAIAATA
jgi:hypothetical protein